MMEIKSFACILSKSIEYSTYGANPLHFYPKDKESENQKPYPFYSISLLSKDEKYYEKIHQRH